MADTASLAPTLPRRFTWDEVIAMSRAGLFGESERVELVGGEIFVMPEEGPLHVLALQIVQRWLIRALPATLELAVRAPLHLPDGTVFVPDLAVYDAGFAPADMVAANARLVIEISDTTLNRDQRRKAPKYAEAGVAELWIVDAPARKITACIGGGATGWASNTPHAAGALAPRCAPAATFALDDLPRG